MFLVLVSTLNVVYRTRLVGLAAINGVVTSEALYSSSTFKDQVATLVPATLSNLQEIELSVLEDELV
jgi:protein EFR3